MITLVLVIVGAVLLLCGALLLSNYNNVAGRLADRRRGSVHVVQQPRLRAWYVEQKRMSVVRLYGAAAVFAGMIALSFAIHG